MAQPKFGRGDLVEKVTGDYQFIGKVLDPIFKLSGEVRYAVEDGRGCVHIFNEGQLRTAQKNIYDTNPDSIEAKIALAVMLCSSPTKGHRGGMHAGQAGYIIYERDGMPFLVGQMLKLFTAHELVKEKDARIQELLEQNAKLHFANQALRQAHQTPNTVVSGPSKFSGDQACDSASQDQRFCASEDETRI